MDGSARVGAIAPGRFAGLVAATDDPPDDITELERATRVMEGAVVAEEPASR